MASPIRSKILRHIVAFTAGLLTVCIALGGAIAAEAATPTPISGSGSTWSENAADKWRRDVATAYGMTVNYAGTGSSAGRRDFLAGSVDFAVSELPFQSAPADGSLPERPTNGFAYIPLNAGATSIVYNLKIDGTRVRDLRLAGKTLAKIFTGVITRWNDPLVQADNPRLRMPDKEITPVVRSDASGSTKQFTQWIATEYPALWGSFCARTNRSPCLPTTQFPVDGNTKAQSGSLGVAGYVSQSYAEGALTYVENAYALKTGFPVAKILNAGGFYTAPTASAVSIALLNSVTNTDAASSDYRAQNFSAVYDSADSRAYPLSYVDYLIAPTQTSTTFTSDKGATLAAFSHYAVCAGQNEVAGLGYGALPLNLVVEGLSQIARIPGATSASVDLSTCSNPTFLPGDSVTDNVLLRNSAAPAACDRATNGQCLIIDYPPAPVAAGVGLAARTIAATDGDLSLSVASNAQVVFADPELVNGVSITRGTIPRLTVSDRRVVSQQGWDLTANIADFVNESDPSAVISSAHVGLAAHLISSTSSGILIAPTQTGGSANYPAPFASSLAKTGVGDTVLTADLTLVSPASSPAGSYDSVLTLTIISR